MTQSQTYPPQLATAHMQISNNNIMQMNNSWGQVTTQPPSTPILNTQIPPNVGAQLESINNQRLALLDQIRQSENNLNAQKEVSCFLWSNFVYKIHVLHNRNCSHCRNGQYQYPLPQKSSESSFQLW